MVCTETVVLIDQLQVSAHVGQFADERNTVQIVFIDIECVLKEPEVRGDTISQTVDYMPITNCVRNLGKNRKRVLVEMFAEEIAEHCLAFQNVKECRITIRKPNKVAKCRSVGTTRTFTR